ncbi:polynucleotide adenylyltransferase PcnB [Rheinheimera sp. UJ63]|uniref:polynucleotide adenylyltransferase PcnB n=2 Tax=Gammaproteobacteria TaxID=1236 RepID=UPI001F2FB04B|nr:polynucleotide adenylyltransferase PcnB [Rheinheimera sp. UJ63]MCF4008272.1 polynucleotide adenylyltransferase PcnB [Rheinheimera sp. UJ63]
MIRRFFRLKTARSFPLRRNTIISRVIDFCRRTLGAKNTETVTTEPVAAVAKTAVSSLPPMRVIGRDQHSISRKDISPNALKVLYRLKDAGFEAYLVGGCIRDLLIGLKPKDFDVVTNARPEEIKQVFRNCRLIGRRFRLAHVVFGREVIEVATFRGHHSGAEDDENVNKIASLSDHGQILRDNVYGTIEEDAERRDFTVNALYYSIKDFTIYDFAEGMQSIANRNIELIGDPDVRYREDPVRILRAIRFATKLNMQLAAKTAAPIPQLAVLLKNIPAPRLFDELVKMWLAGKGFDNFMLMRELKVLKQLLPQLEKLLKQEPEGKAFQLITRALQDTDQRVAQDKPVTPAFIFAALLWYPVEVRAQTLLIESGLNENDAFSIAMTEILDDVQRNIAIPKRFSLAMRDIWMLQGRLTKRAGRRAYKLMEQTKFRGAYDFLVLRAAAEGGDLPELAQWWEQFQFTDEANRLELIQQLGRAGQERPKRRRNYKRKPSHD